MLHHIFPLAYRPDRGLDFLKNASHEDLVVMADLLMHDKGKKRFAQQLSKEPDFVSHQDDLTKCWSLIAAEFQRFGADSIASALRGGEGTTYRDMLQAVCSRLKVRCSPSEAYARVEKRLLAKVFEQAVNQMTPEERADFAAQIRETTKLAGFDAVSATPSALLATMQIAVQMGGFAAYQINMIIVNSVAKVLLGHGLKLATNAALNRALSIFAGPVGWTVTALTSIQLVSGPAYRVVIPVTLYVATLRMKLTPEAKPKKTKQRPTPKRAKRKPEPKGQKR